MKKYTIYIGIAQSDMKTENDKDEVLKTTIEEFKNIGVIGASSQFIKGVWNGQTEDTLLFSFANTGDIREDTIKNCIVCLRNRFKQECILCETQNVDVEFI